MSEIPTHDGPVPEDTGGAQALRARLHSAFETGLSQEDRQIAFTSLREDVSTGKYGGVPLTGDAPAALISILDQIGWTCSAERFARSVPHFPSRFSVIELRESLALLGYETGTRQLSMNEVTSQLLPALILVGDSISLLSIDDHGKISAHDPETGAVRAVKQRKEYEIISVYAHKSPSKSSPSREPWLKQTFRRFVPEIRELLGLTAMINLMVLIISFSVMSIYDKVIPAGAYNTLAAIVFGVALATGLELVFRNLKAKLIGRVSGRLEYLLSTAIFSKLISLPIQMITSTPVGDQISRLRQFESVRDIFAGPFVAVGLELPFVILFTIGIFAIAGPLGFVPVALMITYGLVGALLIGPIRRQNISASQSRREHYQTALETVSNLRLIRSLGCEDVWLERLAEKAAKSASAKRRANLSQRFLVTLSSAGVPIAGAATVVIGALMVISGEMTIGLLIGAMIIIWRVLAPIQQLFLMLARYTEMGQMMTQIDGMMRLPSSVQVDESLVKRSFSGQITFDRCSFRYQGSPQATLQGLSFTIEPGTFVALKGHSGAGKSSILRLILDLYQPQVGSVQIDGVNVRQIPTDNLRAAIGYVPQNPTFFHGTIAQNLRLSAPSASDTQLRRICTEVGIFESVSQLPKGLDTLLDHARQQDLPGGFRQALALAQALLRNPKILLLDEPAKTLGPSLEQAFLASLARRRGNATIIMVSHRPSHIQLADLVLDLDQGQVASFDPPPNRRTAA